MSIRILYFLLFIGIFFTSCVPTKDLIYLQKKGDSEVNSITPIGSKPYRLLTNDILCITVKAIDPKLVEIFNTDSGVQTATSDQLLYLRGYSVDDHGNIRIPILGEVNVLGFTIEEVRQKIEMLLLKDHFKPEAGIYVTVKLSGFKYTVNGEVANAGTKTLYQDRVNIMEASANT